VRGSQVVVAFAAHEGFKRRMVDVPQDRAAVDEALRELAGRPLRVAYELRELDGDAEDNQPSEEEVVARFKAEFDAEEIVPDESPQPDDKEGPA
jgi:hypothetical protein